MASKNNNLEDKQSTEISTISIVVPKYPFDENRMETVEVEWENKTSYITFRYDLKESPDLECLKAIAKED